MILFSNTEAEIRSVNITRHFKLQRGQSLDIVLVALESGNASILIDVDGEGASVNVRGVYVCGGDDRVSVAVNVSHNVGGSVSNQLIKGIASGRAKVDFNGEIVVRPDAQKTQAYQTSCNLLLSEDAVVQTSPQLEIYADDVKCSHGATVGNLDLNEQFYMLSRGISLEQARRLQMISFLSPVLSGLDGELVRKIYDRL